ncbi:MAG TPA: hypothetical protein V6D19_06285 [Stenomitos sp.]
MSSALVAPLSVKAVEVNLGRDFNISVGDGILPTMCFSSAIASVVGNTTAATTAVIKLTRLFSVFTLKDCVLTTHNAKFELYLPLLRVTCFPTAALKSVNAHFG